MEDFKVYISDSTYTKILTAIGYPIIKREEIEALIGDKETFTENIIKQALFDFNQYFPKIQEIQVPSGGSASIGTVSKDTIDPYAFALLSYKFIPGSATYSAGALSPSSFYVSPNPFFSSYNASSNGGASYSRYGTPFPYGNQNNTYQEKFMVKSIEGMNKVYYAHYDEATRDLTYKSSIAGVFSIQLALFENDIDKIPIKRQMSFIKYCQGKLLEFVSSFLSLATMDLPFGLDGDKLEEKGKDLIEEQLTYWREASTIPSSR